MGTTTCVVAGLISAVLAASGCTRDVSEPPPPPEAASVKAPSSISAVVTPTAEDVAAQPPPCERWTGQDVVNALSRQSHEPAVVIPEESDEISCVWALPQTLREELGMADWDGPTAGISINLVAYGDTVHANGTMEWTAPSANELVPNFMGSHEGSEVLPGSPPAAVDGIATVVVATPGARYVELTLFLCGASACRDAAVKAARTLIDG